MIAFWRQVTGFLLIGALLGLARPAAAESLSSEPPTEPASPPAQHQATGELSLATHTKTSNLATNPVASLAPEEHGTTQAMASVVPPEIDPALRASQDAMASTNLVSVKQAAKEQKRIQDLHQKLDQGRQQRRERDYNQAEKTLASLLSVKAPPEIYRSAMLELALLAQDQQRLARAQQIFSQYVQQFYDDPSVPEVMFRQGLLYRQMGAPVMALSKFYAVMSSALTLKLDRLAYYQRLVLQAQTEIADTYYLDGKYEEAADFFNRLLKLESPELNREQIGFKLLRCLSNCKRYSETLAQTKLFITKFPNSDQVPEVRFMMSDALRNLGRKRDAMQEVLSLMHSQRNVADQNQEVWLYWQQRTGNEIANQLYQDGDYLEALEIYLRLAELNAAPTWRLPALYQAALVYERLKQPQKAADTYTRLLEDSKDMGGQLPSAALKETLDMARWRRDRLGWQAQAELANQQIVRATASPSATAAGSSPAATAPTTGSKEATSPSSPAAAKK